MKCTNFPNLFLEWTLHVSGSSSVHHQVFFTVHTAMVYVIHVYRQQAVSKHLWRLPMLCVQWKTPDDGQRNCPKHVEFHSKNKFGKLVHIVDFIIRIWHDARSSERQITPGYKIDLLKSHHKPVASVRSCLCVYLFIYLFTYLVTCAFVWMWVWLCVFACLHV